MAFGRPFLVLIWKNWVIHKRHYIWTIIELILPLLLSFVLAYIASEIPSDTFKDPKADDSGVTKVNMTIYSPFNLEALYNDDTHREKKLLFTPNSTSIHDFLTIAFENQDISLLGFESEESIEVYASTNEDILGAAIFLDFDKSLPILKYKLRLRSDFNTDKTYYISSKKGPRLHKDSITGYALSKYLTSDFLSLQAAIDLAFINLHKKEQTLKDIKLYIQSMLYPPYHYISNFSLIDLIPLMIVYGFIVFIPLMVKRIVDEKNNRAKEMMKMMGMTTTTYWGSVFLSNLILMSILSLTITILYSVEFGSGRSVIGNSSSTLFFALMFFYSISSILFCLVITTIFNKAALAIIATILLWVTSYSVLSNIMSPFGDDDPFGSHSLSDKLSSCILPNMALHWACKMISAFEQFNLGCQWTNLFESPYRGGDGFCLGHIFMMMMISWFIYSLLLWYLDSVWPWQPGVPKSPYFCFLKSYWMNYHQVEEFPITKSYQSSYFEDEPISLSPTVSITHLIKKFKIGKSEKTVVDDLSLNLYPGQITILLGHNGAGKTTTMNILTGMFPPTSGKVMINNYNVVTETVDARKSLGLCPQHNVLYDTLTVKEHLKFFGGLKNIEWSKIDAEVNKILTVLQLSDKENCMSKDLSGGMKRKLSLGIAIIGDSKVLILDEPTSGMDPEARRVIWDALLELRKGKSILLTTHYMEEADALGDRIAIMAEGSIKCCGSPIFLKGKFGTGYQLHIAKGASCKVDDITMRIKNHIPESKIVSDISQELVYSLSTSSQSFGPLFESLENLYSELGIVSCGISVTTMEDVFLKVGKMAESNFTDDDIRTDVESEMLLNSSDNQDVKLACSSRSVGIKLLIQQMKGLFMKRFNYAKRDYAILIFQLVIPLCLISGLITLDNKFSMNINEEALDLNLKTLYGSTDAFYHLKDDNEIPFIQYYKSRMKEEDATVVNAVNITEYQLNKAEDLKTYIENDLVGASTFEKNGNLTIISWFNGVPYHLEPISLNLITSSLLRYLSKENQSNIQIINHPLPSNRLITIILQSITQLIYIIFISLTLTFLSASIVLFPVHERMSKCKLLQRMCGISGITFWFMNLVWDFLIHVIFSFLLLIPFFVCTSISSSLESDAVGAIFFVLILYGFASIPLVYLISFIPKQPSSGFALFTIFSIVTGLIISIIVYTIKNIIPSEDLELTLGLSHLSPIFAAGWAIGNIRKTSYHNTFCNQIDKKFLDVLCESKMQHEYFKCCPSDICKDKCLKKENYISWEFSGERSIAYLIFDGVVYFTILIFLETILPKLCYKLIMIIKQRNKSWMIKNNSIHPYEDSDVAKERNRIEDLFQQSQRDAEALIVKNLTKYFGSFCAVNDLTFSVHKRECFGLLGINGAGKTTTFRMLTGDLIPTYGNAFIGKYDVQQETQQFQKCIGYCPQFDALLNGITAREMLTIFANLRGVPEADINFVVKRLIEMCDLVKHADKTTETYSGGTKRKLSLGLALIGSPSVVLLDEPTAGVDPVSRRKMWETLIVMKQLLGVSFVLTSHGMDECEALCNRIVIMVNGQFHCLGEMQHLKNKFGQGYTLIIKVKRAEGNEILEVKRFVETYFPSSSLKDAHQEVLHYHITDTSVKLSKMFTIMEQAKQSLPIEDYLISDTTLEQIFLAFARTQMEIQYQDT